MSVLYKIKSSIDAFTETERNIAEFIFENKQIVLDSNAKELGGADKKHQHQWFDFQRKMGV